jgi:hypothetical protein
MEEIRIRALRDRQALHAGVTLIQTLITSDSTGKMLKHYRTALIPGPAPQGYPALLTAVLSKLHHSKSNYEYTVSGICNPYLQVKVLLCLQSVLHPKTLPLFLPFSL